MVKRIISILILTTSLAHAQAVRVVTNNYNDLNPERDAIAIGVSSLRITATITDGAAPLNITGLTNATLQIVSRADNWLISTYTPTETTTNHIRWITYPLAVGEYHLTSTAHYIGGGSMPIFSAYLSVTSPPSASGGSCEVTVVVTNTGGSTGGTGTLLQKSDITLPGTYQLGPNMSVTGTVIDAIIPEAFQVASTPSAGQLIAYQGAPYNSATYIGGSPQIGDGIYYDGTNWYYGPQSYSQTHNYGITIGDGVAVYEYTGETNTFVVPLGVSNLLVKLWGAGGGCRGGPGGYSYGYLSVVAGESLNIVVGEGGFYNVDQYHAFGGGGAYRYKSDGLGGGGGGMSAIWRDTNVVAAAGAGGGGCGTFNYSGGAGGGLVGSHGYSSTTIRSYGGTQTNGGYRYGTYLHGGDCESNVGGGAGGGGYFGGGAGSSRDYPGAGGSSYIAELLYATTYATNFDIDDDYVAGVGVAGANGADGGNGLVVIRW